jgi:hypothetical protein
MLHKTFSARIYKAIAIGFGIMRFIGYFIKLCYIHNIMTDFQWTPIGTLVGCTTYILSVTVSFITYDLHNSLIRVT